MARTEISFFTTGNRSVEGGAMPVPRFADLVTEVLDSSGTSVATSTASSQAAGYGFARIVAAADIWVAAGPSPTAAVPSPGTVGAGLRVRAGIATDLALANGDRVAIINATAL
jgi:hypothetical protein